MTTSDQIKAAADHLAKGGITAFPTETVYGLGADATNESAIARVFELKGRPATNPLIVHVSGPEMAKACVLKWTDSAADAASAFWPGPLTLVLNKSKLIPDNATGGTQTVAVRMPDNEMTLALIEMLDRPIVGPSANPSGYVSPTRAEHVQRDFGNDEVLVLDGGPCRAGIESTVLDLTGDTPRILRRGVIGAEDLEPVLGTVLLSDHAESGRGDEPVHSPGLLGPHYRPNVPLVIVKDAFDISKTIADAGGPVALICPPGQRIRLDQPHHSIEMPGLAKGYARELYAALREADGVGAKQIIAVLPLGRDSEIWDAVRERLHRAADRSDQT